MKATMPSFVFMAQKELERHTPPTIDKIISGAYLFHDTYDSSSSSEDPNHFYLNGSSDMDMCMSLDHSCVSDCYKDVLSYFVPVDLRMWFVNRAVISRSLHLFDEYIDTHVPPLHAYEIREAIKGSNQSFNDTVSDVLDTIDTQKDFLETKGIDTDKHRLGWICETDAIVIRDLLAWAADRMSYTYADPVDVLERLEEKESLNRLLANRTWNQFAGLAYAFDEAITWAKSRVIEDAN